MIMRYGRYIRVGSCPFEIYGASTASYGKKVSSTYQRYACGTFLPYSLYLHRLFQKANGKWYFRTDKDVRGSMQKQVFCQKNLSLKSVHGSTLFNSLRVFFVRALYLHRLFQKANGKGHLLFVAAHKLILNVLVPPSLSILRRFPMPLQWAPITPSGNRGCTYPPPNRLQSRGCRHGSSLVRGRRFP